MITILILIVEAGMLKSTNTDRTGSASGTRRDSVAAMLNFLILSQWIGSFIQVSQPDNQLLTSFSLTEKAVYEEFYLLGYDAV
jgi:hypothetical protein